MDEPIFQKTDGNIENYIVSLRSLLYNLESPFRKGDSVAIKLHWGEKGNTSYLHPRYAREIVEWLKEHETIPLIFDTTALYSGGRRTGKDSLKTAAEHGFTEEYLGCPVAIGDGMDGKNVIDIDARFKHFETVQVAELLEKVDGFFIFSHFKGHMVAGFGGAIKNISMGFASRAQKQRMHSDAHPVLNREECTRCGICVDSCPTGAATISGDEYPEYDLEKCIGCAQCIALCPQLALKIFWNTDEKVFQEKLVETAAAVWKRIKDRTLLVNSLLTITADCDCMPGHNPKIAEDLGFLGGYHPVLLDRKSMERIEEEPFNKTYPHVPWKRQFEYAEEIGFI
ncbi:MAG: DUF362 domain-containing protein [Syntrophales bacterium]|nr:DUF362 domain-containing protein [Syntrophales bacterium]